MEKAGQAFTDSGKVGKQFTEDGKVGKSRSGIGMYPMQSPWLSLRSSLVETQSHSISSAKSRAIPGACGCAHASCPKSTPTGNECCNSDSDLML